eukprot:GEMP01080158.1.p2 GENE.GEMP01080158.1~~GEMP01080158.1.p2  ORF type:complete len:134 (-),score=12.10 GEMP01080158.1:298-699(-)
MTVVVVSQVLMTPPKKTPRGRTGGGGLSVDGNRGEGRHKGGGITREVMETCMTGVVIRISNAAVYENPYDSTVDTGRRWKLNSEHQGPNCHRCDQSSTHLEQGPKLDNWCRSWTHRRRQIYIERQGNDHFFEL